MKFWPSRAPGKGVCGGAKILAPPYYSQRAVFASPPSDFSFGVLRPMLLEVDQLKNL